MAQFRSILSSAFLVGLVSLAGCEAPQEDDAIDSTSDRLTRPPITVPQNTIHISGRNDDTEFQLLGSALFNTYAVRHLAGDSRTRLIGVNQSQKVTQACGQITCTNASVTTRISINVTLPVTQPHTPADRAEIVVASLPKTGCPFFSVDLTLGQPSVTSFICGF